MNYITKIIFTVALLGSTTTVFAPVVIRTCPDGTRVSTHSFNYDYHREHGSSFDPCEHHQPKKPDKNSQQDPSCSCIDYNDRLDDVLNIETMNACVDKCCKQEEGRYVSAKFDKYLRACNKDDQKHDPKKEDL